MAEQELISGNAMFLIEPIEQKEKCKIQNFISEIVHFISYLFSPRPTFSHYKEATSFA